MKTAPIRPKTMRATLATATESIQDIMRRMNFAALEIVLVVDETGVLIGTITDGDIRRGLLAHIDLKQTAAKIMNRKPIAIPEATSRDEALAIMRRFSIRHLPMLDTNGRPISLQRLDDIIADSPSPSAVLMAGGLGQRLRPLTENMPKPMLKVADKPIMDHILDGLSESGIRDVVISLNYLGDQIRGHVGNGRTHGLNVNYVTETKRLGTAGALALLQPRPQKPFLVMNSDLLTGINFSSLFRHQRKTRHDMVVCVRKHVTHIPYGVVDLKDDRVLGLQEKPAIEHFINAGIYIMEPHCLEFIASDSYCDMPELILKVMGSGGSVGAFPIIEYWRDIGSPEEYHQADRERREARAQPAPSQRTIPMEIIR